MPYYLRFLVFLYLCLLYLWASLPVHAQSQTTPNVVYSTVNPPPPGASYNWSGFMVTESQGGGLSGGNVPGYNTTTGQFMFGYTPGTIAYAVALNSVLSGTGIQLGGIEYGLQYFNQDYSRGTLSTTITLQNKTGSTLESYYHSLPSTTEGWTNFGQTKTFTNPYLLSNVGNATMSFSGQDDRFWAGYYGPQVRNPYMRFNYTTDICASNPLSSPDCPGYATAYFNQQCTISALYNPSCPGYAAAYFTQQCTANPLYNPACPGYQEAYFAYQCQQDGLYSTTCPNYAEAYAKKNILNIGSTTTTTTTTTSTDTNTTAPKTDPVAIATTSTTTSTTSPTSVTSTTSVISSGSSSTTTAIATTSTQTTAAPPPPPPAAAQEAKKTDNEVKSAGSGASDKTEIKNRVEARAKEVARAGAEAKTFEAQTATQGLVVGLMGFVPGFDAYGQARIIDVNGLQMARQYNRDNVDNRSVLRRLSGASDRLHNEMVDQQYK